MTRNLVVLVLAGAALSSCGQPRVRCFTSIGPYAATFTPTGGSGPCAELKGDVLGLASYNPPRADGLPDLEQATLAIGVRALGALAERAAAAGVVDETEGHARVARGAFPTMEPNEDDLCVVPEMEPAHLAFPALPAVVDDEGNEVEPAQPATDVRYAFSDLRFYVTAGTRGQQMKAKLEYTENGCTATYDVLAVFPAVNCTGEDGGPDDAWCDPGPNATNGGVGSGIQPEFPTTCDPELLLCVLAPQGDAFPVLQEAPTEP